VCFICVRYNVAEFQPHPWGVGTAVIQNRFSKRECTLRKRYEIGTSVPRSVQLLSLPLVGRRKNRTALLYTHTRLFGTLNLSGEGGESLKSVPVT
jgi:hypothetical protein